MSSDGSDVSDVSIAPIPKSTEAQEIIESAVAPRRRILCATDLAPRSDRAVQRAALLAMQMNAEVLFLHVVGDRQPERIIRMKANRARVRLTVQAEKAMADAPERVAVEIHVGKPIKVIAQVAKEWNADMIVVATPVSRRYELLLGTTAERLIRSVACPVLVVNCDPLSQYVQVAVATDLSAMSVKVAQAIAKMGLLDGAYAWFVHAFEPPYAGMTEDEAAARARLETYKHKWADLVTTQLAPDLAAAGLDLSRVRISAEPARPLDAIEHIIEESRPELLVIGTSRWFMLKRMLFKSVAHQVLTKAPCDVLAVSPKSTQREAFERSTAALPSDAGHESSAPSDSGSLVTA